MRASFHVGVWAAAAGFCATLLMCSGRTAPAQPQTADCKTIGSLLGGTGTSKGLNADAHAGAADVRDQRASLATLETYLVSARKSLAAALANGDQSLATYERTIVVQLENGLADNKKLLEASAAIMTRIQQEQRTLQGRAASLGCSTAVGSPRAPGRTSGSTATVRGVDLSGNWVMHLHGVFDSPVEYYDYDAALTGPPGGPWNMVMTLRQTNSQLMNAEPVGHVLSNCTMWLTGPTSIERRCPYPPGAPAESPQHGAILGDHLTLFKMNGLPAYPYGEMRRGTYQGVTQPATSAAGAWRWSATCAGSPFSGTFTISALQADGSFFGQFTSVYSPDVYNGTIAGQLRSGSIVFTRRWRSAGEQQWNGTLDPSGSAMSGNIAGYGGPCTFSANKQ